MLLLRFPASSIELQRFFDLFRFVKFALLIANCDKRQVKMRNTLRDRSGFTMRTQSVLRGDRCRGWGRGRGRERAKTGCWGNCLDFMNYAKHFALQQQQQQQKSRSPFIRIVCIFKFISFAFQFPGQILE